MSESQKPLSDHEALIEAIAEVLMSRAAKNGAVDYPKAAEAIATVLAEMIGPQSDLIRRAMRADFDKMLTASIDLTVLRTSIAESKAKAH